MNARSLGRTGLVVTPVGLGLAALGRPGYINLKHAEDLDRDYDLDAMEAHAHGVLDAAWAAGIRYFDAARSYGRAEAFLASWLARQSAPAHEVTVGSKWGYVYTAGWRVDAEVHEVKDHSLGVLRRQFGESIQILGEYLKLYQVHSASLESGVLEDRQVLAELARHRDNGLSIGLSLSGAKQAETLARALEVTVEGRPLFACVQATWNLLEPSSGAALQAAHEAGMGVIVKEALANGRLTPKNDDPVFRPKRALLEELAATHATTIDALALAAALNQPWTGVVLSGAATPEQLRSNVAALAVTWDRDLQDRLASLAEQPEEYWSQRSRLEWN